MARKIVKRLADLTYSRRPDEVYSDFLHLTEIYLRRLPINVLHVVQHGTMPADDGEDTETWRRIAKKYKKDEFKVFAEATHMLINACDPTGPTPTTRTCSGKSICSGAGRTAPWANTSRPTRSPPSWQR